MDGHIHNLQNFRAMGSGKEEAQVASVVKITEIGADTVKMGSEWF